ncbi:MAG: serine protease [Limisphaerales bacterium]
MRPLLICLSLFIPGSTSLAEPGKPAPVYIDDERHFKTLEDAILKLAHDGKAARGKELLGQMKRKNCNVPPAPPSAPVLQPEEIYTGCSGGVVAITSAWKSDDGDIWTAGEPATAWVVAPDGVLVTNYHVFEDAEKEEVFGILTREGQFHAVTEILAADAVNDVAVFKVAVKGLQPLALAAEEPVGKKVCVISHPDGQFYTFTQGQISRYTMQRDDAKAPPVKYMCITADYARGSSGGPVLNEHGAVVGMVCSTRTTYYGEKGKDPDDDVQMVVKFCIPGESIRALLKPLPVPMPAPAAEPEIPKALPASDPPPAPRAAPVPEPD